MIGSMFGGEQLVIVRDVQRDRHGDPTPGQPAQPRIPVRAAFAPGSSSEDLASRGATVQTTATVYLPSGTDVRRTDTVEARGRTWQVDGDPATWSWPGGGGPAGLVVNLRSVKG